MENRTYSGNSGLISSESRLLLMLLFFLLLTSCKRVECGQYYGFVNEESKNKALLEWVDGNVFNRTFYDGDLRPGSLVGPGGRFKSISEDRSGIKFPEYLSGYEIRFLGPDQYRPNAIFIGRHRYQGLIVARDSLDEPLIGTEAASSPLELRGKRVAVMCYQEKENMMDKRAWS